MLRLRSWNVTEARSSEGIWFMDNASKLVELAKKKFGDLTEAQEKLFSAVANGEVADYSAEDGKDNDPAKAAKWAPNVCLTPIGSRGSVQMGKRPHWFRIGASCSRVHASTES